MCHNLGRITDLIHLDIDDDIWNKPRDIAEAFWKHFHSVYSTSCSGTFSPLNQCTQMLPLVPISSFSVHNAIKRLRPSKSVRLDGIPSLLWRDAPKILLTVLKLIFNWAYFRILSPQFWKQAAIVPVLKKGRTFSIGNHRPIATLNNFSEVF
jgi:hypothetical protein